MQRARLQMLARARTTVQYELSASYNEKLYWLTRFFPQVPNCSLHVSSFRSCRDAELDQKKKGGKNENKKKSLCYRLRGLCILGRHRHVASR